VSPDDKQKLKLLLVATAAYYGARIPDDALALYAEDLEDLPLESIQSALRDLRRDPKTTRLPLPAVIRQKLAPEALSDEDLAIEAVNRIFQAVARFGWPNPVAAREMIGEVGWRVVEMDGGWQTVCRELNEDNKVGYRAQWKGLALVQIRRARMGIVGGPSLPAPDMASHVRGLLKSMPPEPGESS
jgi:hypothetical protein